MSVDQATKVEIYRVPAKRWRRTILAGLRVAHVLPETSGGHDPVCPFWERGKERPHKADDIRDKARPRVGGVCPFTPKQIVGGPGQLGAGYVVHEIEEVAATTIQPGGVSEVEQVLDLRAWFYLPSVHSSQLMNFYTSAYRQIWKRVRLGAEVFASHFTGVNPIFEIRQRDPLGSAVPQGKDGAFDVSIQTIRLHRRVQITGDPEVA